MKPRLVATRALADLDLRTCITRTDVKCNAPDAHSLAAAHLKQLVRDLVSHEEFKLLAELLHCSPGIVREHQMQFTVDVLDALLSLPVTFNALDILYVPLDGIFKVCSCSPWSQVSLHISYKLTASACFAADVEHAVQVPVSSKVFPACRPNLCAFIHAITHVLNNACAQEQTQRQI